MSKVSLLLKNNLLKYLDKHQMSQSDLALKMDTSKSFVNTLFTLTRDHRISIIDKITEATGLEPQDLFMSDQPKETPTISGLVKTIEKQATLLDGNEELLNVWQELDEDQREVFMKQMKKVSGYEPKNSKSKA